MEDSATLSSGCWRDSFSTSYEETRTLRYLCADLLGGTDDSKWVFRTHVSGRIYDLPHDHLHSGSDNRQVVMKKSKAKNIQDVIKFLTPIKGGFGYGEETADKISLGTRDNGNVGDEIPGPEDMDAARSMAEKVNAKFSNISAHFETVDEWTYVAFRWHPFVIPPRLPSSSEMNRVLQACRPLIADILLGAKIIGHERHVSIPSTGMGLSVFKVCEDGVHVDYSLGMDLFKVLNSKTMTETAIFKIGRHELILKEVTKKSIMNAFAGLASITEGYKDMHTIVQIMAVPGGGYLTAPWHCSRPISIVSEPENAYHFTWSPNQMGLQAVIDKYRAKVMSWRKGYAPEPFIQDGTVICFICGSCVAASRAHLHNSKWICDENCWDDRLHATEQT